ncbi:MAG: helix-turn-helix domain-containing protein [bacterium]|nr:helix-turn-helix domain-containing protein [bacterium]
MESRFYTIKQAAAILGVSPLTLRNWDKKGKLIANRHPINNYRVYKHEDLQGVIDGIEKNTKKPKKLAIDFIEDED